MSAGKVFLGVVAGVATGAILGALFAPAKGSVTRKRISRKVSENADDVKEKFNEYVDAITEKYESIKEDAMEWADKGKSKVDAVKAEIKQTKI